MFYFSFVVLLLLLLLVTETCFFSTCLEPKLIVLALYIISYLKDGEVLENAVHHVLFGQVFELVNKVDHVLAHGRTMDAVNETAILKSGVFRLDFLNHLLAKGAHLC